MPKVNVRFQATMETDLAFEQEVNIPNNINLNDPEEVYQFLLEYGNNETDAGKFVEDGTGDFRIWDAQIEE